MFLTKLKNFFIRWFYILKYYLTWVLRNSSKANSDNMTCLVGKTAIVTGGNSGIGYATSLLLASRGCRIIIACRRDAKTVRDTLVDMTGNSNISTKYLDLSKFRSIRAFAEDIKKSESKIDILVNNAGIGITSDMQSEDGLNTVMQVNYLGPFLLTHLLVDLLKKSESANIVFSSSLSVSLENFRLDDLKYKDSNRSTDRHLPFYINSKFCNIVAAQMFGKKLGRCGILVNCADPGVVRTQIFELSYQVKEAPDLLSIKILMETILSMHAKDVLTGAETVFHLAASRNLQSGGHYFRCKPFMKPRKLEDQKFCEQVWRMSEELVKLNHEEKLNEKFF